MVAMLNSENQCNLIRIVDSNKWETAFCIKQGLFVYTVTTFGLTKAPISFQGKMNRIFKDMEGYMWSLDDIHIYGGNIEERTTGYCTEGMAAMC